VCHPTIQCFASLDIFFISTVFRVHTSAAQSPKKVGYRLEEPGMRFRFLVLKGDFLLSTASKLVLVPIQHLFNQYQTFFSQN
jgi:hypothetical protein